MTYRFKRFIASFPITFPVTTNVSGIPATMGSLFEGFIAVYSVFQFLLDLSFFMNLQMSFEILL